MNELHQEVRRRLATLNLEPLEREEVIAEITTHLELLAAADSSAHESTSRNEINQLFDGVGDWEELKKQIENSKERGMKVRLRKIWLPALGTAFLAYAAQSIIAHLVAWPRVARINGLYLVYNWQWLFVLLVTGALGAYWSRMMGGSVRDRVVVALAPSEILGAFVIALLPLDLAMEWVVGRQVPYALTHPVLVVAMLTWLVVLPAVPSIVGAAWFLRADGVNKSADRLQSA